MIKIELRPEPDFFHSKIVDLALEKLDEFYEAKERNQSRYNWPFNREIDDGLKPFLHEEFNSKCGYCETELPNLVSSTVDRYRPNNGVRDEGKYYQDLYWWLAFEWDNLILCCKECNQYKANYFPIKGVRALTDTDSLVFEKPQIINPLIDTPELHFSYNDRGEITALSTEGSQTIELLRLNRTTLIEQRLHVRNQVIEWIEVVMNKPHEETRREIGLLKNIYELQSVSMSFLGYRKSVLQEELETNPFLGEFLDIEDFNSDENWIEKIIADPTELDKIIKSDYFPIEYVYIKNFKSISELKIDFKPDELNKKSWLFLLGENGVGKSSILQALAIGLKADRKLLEGRISTLIKKGEMIAEIVIKERESDTFIKTILTRKDETIQQSGTFSSYLIGYGSLRLSSDEVDEEISRDVGGISYDNLFRAVKPLNDITKWLTSLYLNDISFFDRIAYSIRQLLPHDFPDNELTIANGELMFKNSNEKFSELSDGFKSTIILAVDIMMKLSNAQSDMDKMSGIVLIDELGNQLHPRWQMRIVRQLRVVFPNINFIISTHHPLCLRGADQKEILLLKKLNMELVAVTDLPDPSSLRVDQLLASEFFGLNSLVDPEIEAKFNQYYCLLAKPEPLTDKEENERDLLKDELRNKQQMGGSLREELMYTVIDKLLAQKVAFDKKPLNRSELKEEVVKRVEAVWRNLNLDGDD